MTLTKPPKPTCRIWDRSELRWIWTYQVITTVAAAYPIIIALGQRNTSLPWIFQNLGLSLPVVCLLLISVEAALFRVSEPSPWVVTSLQGVQSAISSLALAGSTMRYQDGLWRSHDRNAFARILAVPTQDLVIVTIWWLACYNGLAHSLAVWRLHRRRAGPDITLSQFSFTGTLSLWPVHLARWACEVGTGQHDLAGRGWFLLMIPMRLLASLGLFLALCTRYSLRGEPQAKILTRHGIRAVREGHESDPYTSDYPIVRARQKHNGFSDAVNDGSVSRGSVSSSHMLESLPTPEGHVPSRTNGDDRTEAAALQRPLRNAPSRRLRPRYLCVVDDTEERGYRMTSTAGNSGLDSIQYVFLSYTRMHWWTNIEGDPSADADVLERTRGFAVADTATLTSFAIHAAKQAGVAAFWIDFECLRPDVPDDAAASKNIGDVYHICDIVRGAYCMAIAVGPPTDPETGHQITEFSPAERRSWLYGYGSRLWTLPEALLCPSNHGVLLYFATSDGFQCERTEKRNLPERIWTDAESARDLIEHYEGSLNLSQIDLISLALQCLHRRKTVTRMSADFIYALMGLLRERVAVQEKQSTFEAFAYLSLANDSQKLLERLFCMHNTGRRDQWHDMSDLWGANIRDVIPACEVTEVCEGDTVRIARMPASTIEWTPLPTVDFELARPKILGCRLLWSWQRGELSASFLLLALLLGVALFQVLLLIFKRDGPSMRRETVEYNLYLAFFIIPAIVSFVSTCMFLPSSLYRIYGGEIKNVQARFLGFHGVPDLATVEETLFGRQCGRITWSPLNSQPTPPGNAEESTCTLIDTYLLTAHRFYASTVPSIVAVSGNHRGTLRAMLCSYDEVEGVYSRETVIRMDERVLQRMSAMDPERFSLLPATTYRDDED